MFAEVTDVELAAAIDATAAEVLWEAGVVRPPVDALAVAEELGLTVAHDDDMPHRGRCVRQTSHERGDGGSTGTIVVRRDDRPEREQWAVAHEIGECVAHRVYDRLGVDAVETAPTAREWIANRFANALLLPRRWFAADGQELNWDLPALKHCYDTASHELVALRMLDMPVPVVITVCDLGRVRWRRSNVTAWPPVLLPDERSIWRRAHTSGLPATARLSGETGIEAVHCWPIHEPEWKREILRSEVVQW